MEKTQAPSSFAAETEGDFYVQADCCLLCGVPEAIAPEIFESGLEHCFVRRQPCSPDELDRTIEAMWSSEVDCIRYRGRDADLLKRLGWAGMSRQADHPQASNAPVLFRDRVTFRLPPDVAGTSSASHLAALFRADMRASGRKVLPALIGRRTIWVSWFRYRFHRVDLVRESDGSFVARLRSLTAPQGLAWLVDGWLRAKRAETVSWEVTGDRTSASRAPM